MNFGKAVKCGFKNYANFQGRTTRSEFWRWTLFSVIAWWIILEYVLVLAQFVGHRIGQGSLSPVVEPIFVVAIYAASFAASVPMIAIGVRRLHDIDASGGWLIFGFLTYIFLLTRRSDPFTNRYDQPDATEFATALELKTWQKVVGVSLLMVVIGAAFAIENSFSSKEARRSAASVKVSSSPAILTPATPKAPNIWNFLMKSVEANRSACASVRAVQTKLFSVMADYGKAAATTDDAARALGETGVIFVDVASLASGVDFRTDLSQTGLALKQTRVALLSGNRAAWTRAGAQADTELKKVNDFCNMAFPVAKP